MFSKLWLSNNFVLVGRLQDHNPVFCSLKFEKKSTFVEYESGVVKSNPVDQPPGGKGQQSIPLYQLKNHFEPEEPVFQSDKWFKT